MEMTGYTAPKAARRKQLSFEWQATIDEIHESELFFFRLKATKNLCDTDLSN